VNEAPDIPVRSRPPSKTRRRLARLELGAIGGLELRARTFWTGRGGGVITFIMAGLVVALLVGWVLLWLRRPGAVSILMLTLGSVAFAAVLTSLIVLWTRLRDQFRLRQAEAAFLTGVSHNLRTPISAIRVAAQAMQAPGINPGDQNKLSQAIVSETRRLALRVHNVLEAGRLDVEPLRYAPEPVDISELVRQSLVALRPIIEGKEGSLELNAPDSLWVRGDPQALGLLLDNLLDNALSYASGPPRLQLQIRARGPFAWLAIRDWGMGFPESVQERLFRRFGRGDSGEAGTGLGLALSRAIARGHGGEVELMSPGPDKGAQAEVWLPLVEPFHG